jgi:hypothetical protein
MADSDDEYFADDIVLDANVLAVLDQAESQFAPQIARQSTVSAQASISSTRPSVQTRNVRTAPQTGDTLPQAKRQKLATGWVARALAQEQSDKTDEDIDVDDVDLPEITVRGRFYGVPGESQSQHEDSAISSYESTPSFAGVKTSTPVAGVNANNMVFVNSRTDRSQFLSSQNTAGVSAVSVTSGHIYSLQGQRQSLHSSRAHSPSNHIPSATRSATHSVPPGLSLSLSNPAQYFGIRSQSRGATSQQTRDQQQQHLTPIPQSPLSPQAPALNRAPSSALDEVSDLRQQIEKVYTRF